MALFRSPYKGFVQKVRSAVPFFNAQGFEVPSKRLPSIRAEFGVFGSESNTVNPETGENIVVADIRGGFFDTLEAQKANGWSDEDREYTEEILRHVAGIRPDYIQELVPLHVPAPPPWPTYDRADHEQAARLAVELSLVPEAIRYERENANRAAVLEPLNAALLDLDEDSWNRSESVTEIPADQLEPMATTGVRVGKAPEMTDSGIVKNTPGLTLNNPATIVL